MSSPLCQVIKHGEHCLGAQLTQIQGTILESSVTEVIMFENSHDLCINLPKS